MGRHFWLILDLLALFIVDGDFYPSSYHQVIHEIYTYYSSNLLKVFTQFLERNKITSTWVSFTSITPPCMNTYSIKN
jgi:hypothetical protein